MTRMKKLDRFKAMLTLIGFNWDHDLTFSKFVEGRIVRVSFNGMKDEDVIPLALAQVYYAGYAAGAEGKAAEFRRVLGIDKEIADAIDHHSHQDEK